MTMNFPCVEFFYKSCFFSNEVSQFFLCPRILPSRKMLLMMQINGNLLNCCASLNCTIRQQFFFSNFVASCSAEQDERVAPLIWTHVVLIRTKRHNPLFLCYCIPGRNMSWWVPNFVGSFYSFLLFCTTFFICFIYWVKIKWNEDEDDEDDKAASGYQCVHLKQESCLDTEPWPLNTQCRGANFLGAIA